MCVCEEREREREKGGGRERGDVDENKGREIVKRYCKKLQIENVHFAPAPVTLINVWIL